MRNLFRHRNRFHILFWIMYVIFTLMETRGYVHKRGWLFMLQPLSVFFLLMGLLMLFNNRIFIPRFLEKGKKGFYIGGLLVSVAAYTYLRSMNQLYWDRLVWPEDKMFLKDYWLLNFLYAIWFLIISSLLYFTQKWTDHQQRRKNIQITELQTELKYLRSQLHPHFLFNALNTIYGYIDMENEEARNTLLQFSELMQYHLYDADVDWVGLGRESKYLSNYVALQRARSSTYREISLDIRVKDETTRIAPLLFLPFVENAFKFSTRDDGRAAFVDITLEQTSSQVVFSCRNSYDPSLPAGSGIGLANVRRRLDLLYPGRHVLEIVKEEEIFSVTLIIRL